MGNCGSICVQNNKEEEIVVEKKKSFDQTQCENVQDNIQIAKQGKKDIEDIETIKDQEQSETKVTFRANIHESDLHCYACEILDILGDIREFPNKYVEYMESLKNKLFDLKVQGTFDPYLPTEEEIDKTKDLLLTFTNREIDCIMWNEKLFHSLRKRLNDFNPYNTMEIMTEIKSAFPNLKIIDFTLFTHLNTVDTLLMMISKSQENFNLLLNQNYHYGAAIVGVNSDKLPITKVFLANEII